MSTWKAVIGLEIHVQLKTKLKLFSPAPTSFGDEPNRSIHPCCTGLPGALPRLSQEPVNHAIRLGLALESKIHDELRFDRKSYFYPDSPRNFQITQFFHPILQGGYVCIPLGDQEKHVHIRDAHLEDDTAILKHLPGVTGIDFNRAGMPLIEIVTEPDIETPEEAALFVSELKLILEYLNISDCDMEKGQLRVDANVSVRKEGEAFRPKCEIKNLNSISILTKALKIEMERQIRCYDSHPEKKPEEVILSSTFRWDAQKKTLILMRTKDTATDYRYFPEPDLPPTPVPKGLIEEIRQKLPELPKERRATLREKYSLHTESLYVLVSDQRLFLYFEEAAHFCKHFQQLANWIIVEFSGQLRCPIYMSDIKPQHVASLVELIMTKKLSGKNAKVVAAHMVETFLSPEEILKQDPSLSLSQDTNNLNKMITSVLEEHPDSILDYRNGKMRALNFLVGKVMSSCKQADPAMVREVLLQKMSSQ
ncbi:Asp-tRNA(Asn)/Glu-tRNA(Gln) amidotransferase subunit GatB [Candidatus Similichlamydia laticola]|uniref:Aspartyl/glutamyl-tRNA(Asn/Gln) amidotransferase subunit B n=1 Tax=Candidatus Similichlamydia laticola TaxID=2170265 RepID=A0A369KI54_9BACT|nr:Asp-tRNA(Asn)/Glu-tRNA(Gln) amidotransferase subunit GatB [Candidatus Similichlamydia laticola]RDB31473.1 Aspartyl-tRNA(Asn)-Glutamyl-tRNA(Gln) amidotransferase subunit B [Candidatus Similichlamydia laticola]